MPADCVVGLCFYTMRLIVLQLLVPHPLHHSLCVSWRSAKMTWAQCYCSCSTMTSDLEFTWVALKEFRISTWRLRGVETDGRTKMHIEEHTRPVPKQSQTAGTVSTWDLMSTRGSFGYDKCSGSREWKCSFFGWTSGISRSLCAMNVRKGGETRRWNHRTGSPKVRLHSMTPALGGRSQLWVILTWLGVNRS